MEIKTQNYCGGAKIYLNRNKGELIILTSYRLLYTGKYS